MSYQINYLPSALHDLTDIARYIGVKLSNPAAADRLADRILHMTADGMREYIGGYDDYLEAIKNTAAGGAQETAQPSAAAMEYREKKAYQSELNKAKTAVSRAEKGVADAERELEEINSMLARADIATNYVKAGELSKKAEEAQRRLDKLYEEWERAEKRLAELTEGTN